MIGGEFRGRRLAAPASPVIRPTSDRVREAIFDRIRSERAKKVAEYQSEGERLAADIRSASEREVAEMKSTAMWG